MIKGHMDATPITVVRVQKKQYSISCRRALDVAVIKLCLWTECVRDDFARTRGRLDNIKLFPLNIKMDHKKQIKMWIAAILGLFLVLDGEQINSILSKNPFKNIHNIMQFTFILRFVQNTTVINLVK